MRNRSYKQLLGKLREVEVPSYDKTSLRFLRSLETERSVASTVPISTVVFSSLGILAVAFLLHFMSKDNGSNHEHERTTGTHEIFDDLRSQPLQKSDLSSTIESSQQQQHSPYLSSSGSHSLAMIAEPSTDISQPAIENTLDPSSTTNPNSARDFSYTESEHPIPTISDVQPASSLLPSLSSHKQLAAIQSVDFEFEHSEGFLLFASTHGIPGLTASYELNGRISFLTNVSSELFVGIATGLTSRLHNTTEFAGFKDTLIEVGSEQILSRIGYYSTSTERLSDLQIGAALSYQPTWLMPTEDITSSLVVFAGFDGGKVALEQSLLFSIRLSDNLSPFVGLSSKASFSPFFVRFSPAVGVSASF